MEDDVGIKREVFSPWMGDGIIELSMSHTIEGGVRYGNFKYY